MHVFIFIEVNIVILLDIFFSNQQYNLSDSIYLQSLLAWKV